LSNHVAIITGSGNGIGEACAKKFAAEGCAVVVSDLDPVKSDKVAADINAAGGRAISVPGDVTDAKWPELVVSKTIQAFGKLNLIVNNAGYTWDSLLQKTTDKQWEAMLAVHQTAPFRLIRAAAPYMRDAGKKEMDAGKKPENRCIINVSSTSGLHGNFGQANYATAKAGVSGLTKTVAKEWGPFGVRCNTVAFGLIETRLTSSKEGGASIIVDGKPVSLGIPEATRKAMAKVCLRFCVYCVWNNVDLTDLSLCVVQNMASIPLARGGQVEEAAGGVFAMCIPEAAYITGHTLEVTGGAGI
jgi:3-oxoacyl-[acyl-carrier protein] reductase